MKRKILQIIVFSAVTALFTAGCDGCDNGGGNGGTSSTAKTYTVTYEVNGAFDANGDEVKKPASQTVEEGEEITLDSIGGDEYPFIFRFWTEEQTDTAGKKSYLAGESYKVTKDITLYAQWDSAYIVVFDAKDAKGKTPPPQKQVSGGSITLPDEGGLIMDDYIFNGWDTHKSGSANTYGVDEAYTVTDNVTLYAQWAALNIDVGEMVKVTGGTFAMGESGEEKDIDDFFIGNYEVTQKLWRDVTGKNPSYFKGDSLPVTNVSWDDIQEFLAALNEKDPGKNYRLPKEAEWEYAARGGDNNNGYSYSGSNTPSEVAVYNASEPAKAGSKNKANELGLYDMSGNVWEWVYDESDIDPNESGSRIIRGGSWVEKRAEDCSVSRRQSWGQSGGSKDLGFRLASD